MSDVASASVLANLGINLQAFVAQLVNFALAMLILWRFGYRPLRDVMAVRDKKIAQGLADAREGKRLLEDAEAERIQLMKDARREANELLGQAQREATEERQRLMAQTSAELERQLADAKLRLAREKAQALELARRELARLVIDATRRVTGGFSEQDHRDLVERSVAEVTAQDVL